MKTWIRQEACWLYLWSICVVLSFQVKCRSNFHEIMRYCICPLLLYSWKKITPIFLKFFKQKKNCSPTRWKYLTALECPYKQLKRQKIRKTSILDCLDDIRNFLPVRVFSQKLKKRDASFYSRLHIYSPCFKSQQKFWVFFPFQRLLDAHCPETLKERML